MKKPQWVGKIERYDEPTPDWNEQRKKVFKRDRHKCKWCKSEERLVVHHKSYREVPGSDEELKHLITLCENCHNEFHKTHKYDRIEKRHT